MTYKEGEWNGFRSLEFELDGRYCCLVLPKEAKGDKWLLKTEYFYAFPNFEIAMLERGWHLAYIANSTRWYKECDADAKAMLCAHLHEHFGLSKKCVCVGMSCGGMHAVYFGARHPECVQALYLDAPVLNLLSCPCNLGREDPADMYEEFYHDIGMSVSQLLNYRNHPIDNVGPILEHKIPVMLICGDSDHIVPYEENGMVLSEILRKHNHPFREILKPGIGHHPHGLEDPTPLIAFAEETC